VNECTDAIIVGGGAAGLAAARELNRRGAKFLLLEARPRLGGRIYTHTLHEGDSAIPIELGAEFIHGRPPQIFDIADALQVQIVQASDRRLLCDAGHLKPLDDFWTIIDEIDSQIPGDHDQTYADFLRDAKAPPLHKRIAKAYVEGFNASQADVISAKGIKEDDKTSEEIDGQKQFRIVDGYDTIVNELVHSFPPNAIRLGCPVRAVNWSGNGGVEVSAQENGSEIKFHSNRLLVALPHMVLRRSVEQGEGILFNPPLDVKRGALSEIETGHAVKIVMQFLEPFWEHPAVVDNCESFGFAMCLEADFPTWWTQAPNPSHLLTGWAGGAQSDKLIGRSEPELEAMALQSLSQTFHLATDQLRRLLVRSFIHDWRSDQFALGAYTYLKVNATEAPKKLAEPIDGRLFFAGEATSTDFNGTVHGAIESGIRAAREISG
jgi:monoamine oxidase